MSENATAAAETGGKTKKETQIETVTMGDGRIVEFAGKRKMLKEGRKLADGTLVLHIDFRNGMVRDYPLRSELFDKYALHGAEQKYGDETAGLDDVEDMVLATDELHERLNPEDPAQAPEWSTKREGNGLGGTSVLARALAEVKGVDIQRVRDWLKTKTAAEKTALRLKNPEVKAAIERIEAAKANTGTQVDTSKLLDELGEPNPA